MEYNSFIMAAFVPALLAITAFMDTPVKPAVKEFLVLFSDKTGYKVSERTRYAIYQVVAFVVALLFVLTVDKLSFAKLFYVVLDEEYVWGDRLATALVLSVGSKSFNWIVKGVQDNGPLLVQFLKLKIGLPEPEE